MEKTLYETGRMFIPPCCTAATVEFVNSDEVTYLRCRVAGHGWTSEPWEDSLDNVNDTGTFVDYDGTEHARHYRFRTGD
jgi:hypothetical protein